MTTKKTEKNQNQILQSPKGMRDLIGDEVFSFQGFAEKAAEIALYYGFKPIETPILEKEEIFARGVGAGTDITEKEMYSLKTKGGDYLALRPEGTASVMRAYFEHGMQAEPQPVMLYYFGPFFRHENPQAGRYRQFWQFGLEVLGTKKSIADAMVINITKTILQEAGIKDIRLLINSIGNNDCRAVYRRELGNYYKKHLKEICADCRERLKKNPLRVLDCKNPKCQPIKENAPASISFLTGESKQHFKEVLEYLDSLNVTYEIDNTLVRGLDYYTHTIFEFVAEDTVSETAEGQEKETKKPLSIAGGGRYDYLAKALGGKKDTPAVGASIGVDRLVALDSFAKLTPRIVKKPKVFFIQLSFEAKLKSFEIIEILRKAKIPIAQSLAKDSLGIQLGLAEKIGVPYTIILGQKEALENTVIVRDMDSRSQDTVKISDLGEYIKKIK